MGDLEEALTAFVQATRDKLASEAEVNHLGRKVLQLSRGRPAPELNGLLDSLGAGLDAPHPQVAGYVALICGCVVEDGGSPTSQVAKLLERTMEALRSAGRVVEAVRGPNEEESAVEDDGESEPAVMVGDRQVSGSAWKKLLQVDPSAVQSFLALDHFCQPLIAMLTRAPDQLAGELVPGLRDTVAPLAEMSEFAGFLDRLLRVPVEEKWLVVDPRVNRGWELAVSGVANAFQVYALIHRALLAAPRGIWRWRKPVPGPEPASEALAVATGEGPQSADGVYVPPFTLFRWSAVRPEKRVPDMDEYREWYSNSAVPAELAWHEDARIGVLGDFGIKMELPLAREFAALPASVELRGELEKRHVIELLNAFAEAGHPGHPVPGVGWPRATPHR